MARGQNIVGFFFLLIVSFSGYSQTQDSYDYQSEFTWGINKNTSGGLIGGFVFKKSRKLQERMLETYGLEIMNVKHPQEVRLNTLGNFFTYGKSNYLYAFRFQYGRDLILFKKAPQQGVEIKAILAAGPSLGIVAPYYVEWDPEGAGSTGGPTFRSQWNPEITASKIIGPGRLFEGLGESTMVLGANFKAALNFELGTFKSQVTGFEAGFLLDAYAHKVVMVPTSKNYSSFPTLFITFFYGTRK
jgi:hypothetical protein